MGKMKAGAGKRIGAWLLSFAMIISLVIVPDEKTKAAEELIALSYTTDTVTAAANEQNQVSVNLGNGGYSSLSDLQNAGVTALRISFEVTAAEGSGTPGAQAFINAKNLWEGKWVNVYAGSGTQTVELDLTQYYSNVAELYNFGFQFENVTNVTYKISQAVLVKSDSTGGSSGSEGTGSSGNSSVNDTSTNKDLEVEFNYAKALQESLYFYDANMCGNLEGTCALSWRGNCHTYDKNVTYTKDGKTYSVDASGGFHDAGDHVKFGLPQGYAASMLGMSYYQFGDAFDELGQTAHLKKITDYFCDYFRRCTVYDESEKVIAFCYQVGEGNSDHSIWSAPESQTLNRPAYFADASNPATDEVSVAIAALAINYINFKNADDLKVAKDLFTFVQANNKACATEGASGFYDSTSYGDDLALAASALYVATGDASYNTVYNQYKDNSGNGVNQYWVLDWANTGALACMLQGNTTALSSIVNVCKNKPTIDGVFHCVDSWGSCRYSAAEQFVGLVYDKLTGTSTYTAWATSQMNYMLGDNPNKRCYIVGYNENSSQYPHHRAASRSTDAGVTNANHYTLLGALVGGPGSDGTYQDNQSDYHCNEVALDYNAGLVGAAAGLYLKHKNDDAVYLSYAKKNTENFSNRTASAAELSEIGVTTYYGIDAETPDVPCAENPYAIDVSRLDDADYLKSLRKEDDTATVSYQNYVLTLTETGADYVITGMNEMVTIKTTCASYVTLQNVKIKAVDAEKATIQIQSGTANAESISCNTILISGGTVTVSKGIKATDDITISGGMVIVSGDEKQAAMEAGNEIYIKNAEVTAEAGKQASAIEAEQIKIENAAVTVSPDTDSGTSAIQSDNITLIGENTVSASTGNQNIYSSTPKDENGNEIVVTVPVSRIVLNKTSIALEVNKKEILAATVLPDDATESSVLWSSSNETIATVSQLGEVTGLAVGTAVITVTANDGSGITASCTVTVKKSEESVEPGQTPETPTKPTESIKPTEASTETPTKPTESTKPTEVSTETPTKPTTPTESTKPTEASTETSTEAPVNTTTETPVKVVKVKKVKVTGITKKVAPGKKISLKATVYPKNAKNRKIKWVISKKDKKYASINSKGVLTARKKGAGKKITVTAVSAENGKIKGTYKISIMKKPVKKIKLSARKTTIKKKQSVTVKAKFTPTKGISKEVTWTSSNPKVAKVNAKGKVTGKKKGKVKIIAKAKDGSGKKASIIIRVK